MLIFYLAVVIDFTSKNLIVEHFRSSALYLASSIYSLFQFHYTILQAKNQLYFSAPSKRFHSVCAKRNFIGRKPTSLRSTSFARSATSFICVRKRTMMLSESSNDVACATQMMLCPADTNEKIQVFRLGFFGRGRRIRTRDPRFWSGSKMQKKPCKSSLFSHFSTFFSQDRVSKLCLKIFDAFLMLRKKSTFHYWQHSDFDAIKTQNLHRCNQRKFGGNYTYYDLSLARDANALF